MSEGTTTNSTTSTATGTTKKATEQENSSVEGAALAEARKNVDPISGVAVHKDKVADKDFVYSHHLDPNRKIPGTNPYLDDVERRQAEVRRAQLEDRKPDLKNPGSTQSTPLVSVEQVKASTGVAPKGEVTLPVRQTTQKDLDAKRERELKERENALKTTPAGTPSTK